MIPPVGAGAAGTAGAGAGAGVRVVVRETRVVAVDAAAAGAAGAAAGAGWTILVIVSCRAGEVKVGYRHTRKVSLQDFDIGPCWSHGDPSGGEGAGDRPADVARRASDNDVAPHHTGSFSSR